MHLFVSMALLFSIMHYIKGRKFGMFGEFYSADGEKVIVILTKNRFLWYVKLKKSNMVDWKIAKFARINLADGCNTINLINICQIV